MLLVLFITFQAFIGSFSFGILGCLEGFWKSFPCKHTMKNKEKPRGEQKEKQAFPDFLFLLLCFGYCLWVSEVDKKIRESIRIHFRRSSSRSGKKEAEEL